MPTPTHQKRRSFLFAQQLQVVLFRPVEFYFIVLSGLAVGIAKLSAEETQLLPMVFN